MTSTFSEMVQLTWRERALKDRAFQEWLTAIEQPTVHTMEDLAKRSPTGFRVHRSIRVRLAFLAADIGHRLWHHDQRPLGSKIGRPVSRFGAWLVRKALGVS